MLFTGAADLFRSGSKTSDNPNWQAWDDERTQLHMGVCIQCQGQGSLILTEKGRQAVTCSPA